MPVVTRSWFLALLTIAATFTLVETSSAQDVQWRHDYARARREATDSGKPLLLDFGTEACVWCRKLDATTFRSRQIVQILNERYIPVKIDARQYEDLTQAMGVVSFPTLVIAGPDGRVLDRHKGYLEASELSEMLGESLAKVRPAATRPTVAAAPAAPAPVPAAYPSPAIAADDPLAAARRDFEAGRYLACLERCDRITDGPMVPEARRLARRVTEDPALWRRACQELNARLDAIHSEFEINLR